MKRTIRIDAGSISMVPPPVPPRTDKPEGRGLKTNVGDQKKDQIGTINLLKICGSEEGGGTWVVFCGLVRALDDAVFACGESHKVKQKLIAPKEVADKLEKSGKGQDAEQQGCWESICEFTEKLMVLNDCLKKAHEIAEKKKDISPYFVVEYDPTYEGVLSLIGKEKGEYVEYGLKRNNRTYEKDTSQNNGIIAECRKYYKKLIANPETRA